MGRALARRFAKDGEKVVLLGRTLSKIEKVAEEIGDAAMAVQCDVADPDSVRTAFAAIGEKHQKIDVLINNAAIFEPFLIVEAKDSQIMNALTINLAGPMLCCRSAIPMMKAGGHIINVTSESVDLVFPYLSVYAATKAGLERWSTSLREELVESGIRVSVVRAAPMTDEDKTWDIDPEVGMRFAQAAADAGFKLLERPISHFNSATDVFRALLDLPEDLHADLITLRARKKDD